MVIVVLCPAYVAAVSAIVSGVTNMNVSFYADGDMATLWAMYRGAFMDGNFPLDGMRLGAAPQYIPDTFGLLALYHTGLTQFHAHMLWPLMLAVLSAGGWLALCFELYGPTLRRVILVILLHALPFLHQAAGPNDVFALTLLPSYHYGVFACISWMLLLSVRALAGNRPLLHAAGLWVLLSWVAAGDLLVYPWFVAPMAVILAVCALPHCGMRTFGKITFVESDRTGLLMVAGAIALSLPISAAIVKALPFILSYQTGNYASPNLGALLESAASFFRELADIAAHNWLPALIWMAFAALSVWRLWLVFFPVRQQDAGRMGAVHMLVGSPSGLSHAVVIQFIAYSAACAALALLATGNFNTAELPGNNAPNLRYVIPFAYFPLYVGWALLPWRLPWSGRFVRYAGHAAATAAGLLAIALAWPNFAKLRSYDPFATDFYNCFSNAAERLDWKGGIGSFYLNEIFTHPTAGVERYIPVGVVRAQEKGESLLYLDWHSQNRHWFNGEFQFVAVNGYDEWAFPDVPIGKDSPRCHFSKIAECVEPNRMALILDEAAAVGAFGEPQEVVVCEGVAFFHYDPAIRQDFSNIADPSYMQVGNAY